MTLSDQDATNSETSDNVANMLMSPPRQCISLKSPSTIKSPAKATTQRALHVSATPLSSQMQAKYKAKVEARAATQPILNRFSQRVTTSDIFKIKRTTAITTSKNDNGTDGKDDETTTKPNPETPKKVITFATTQSPEDNKTTQGAEEDSPPRKIVIRSTRTCKIDVRHMVADILGSEEEDEDELANDTDRKSLITPSRTRASLECLDLTQLLQDDSQPKSTTDTQQKQQTRMSKTDKSRRLLFPTLKQESIASSSPASASASSKRMSKGKRCAEMEVESDHGSGSASAMEDIGDSAKRRRIERVVLE